MERLEQIRIRDLVDVPPVQTVVRVEQGRTDSAAITASFVLTAEVAGHLGALANAFCKPHGTGCFVQGDFGSGKSHLLAALAAVVGRLPGHEAIARNHPAVAAFTASPRRLLAVDISLVNHRAATPLERIVTGAIEEALAAAGAAVALSPLRQFVDHLRTILGDPSLAAAFCAEAGVDAGRLHQWLETEQRDAYAAGIRFLASRGLPQPEALVAERSDVMRRALDAARTAGYDGIVLLLDELSEFFRAKPDPAALNEDARTLQFLGELAQTRPLWTIAAVQESIERTGDIGQATFRKIKDRFPLRLPLSTLHIRDLIARRLVVKKPGAVERIAAVHDLYRRHFKSFATDPGLFQSVYPVHPATLTLLEGLGDLFSQHRGIVDFVYSRIAGDPSRDIEGILDRPCTEMLAPDSIYEHFAGRLMEFSAFNVYPRHIVPHLDQTISEVLSDDQDRRLARRIVRMLVLYALHPAAPAPTARLLAELAACTIAAQDPDLNAQFVAEAILQPLAAASRFLQRKPGTGADPLEATYRLTVAEDQSKVLRARIEQRARAIRPDDSRIVLEPLAELEAPGAWPGRSLWEGVEMPAMWRQSSRRLLALFVLDGNQERALLRARAALERGSVDGVLAIVYGDTTFSCEHTVVWRLGRPEPGQVAVLAEAAAAAQVLSELRPSSPADAPLIPLAREAVSRLAPAVREALLGMIYAGAFDDPMLTSRVEPAARQVKHFDRLLQLAVMHTCETRYPRFADIAPRAPLSPMLYQRMLDEAVAPGAITLRQAREKGIADALDTAGVALGLFELRGGSYTLAPNPAEHPFLGHLFGLVRAGQPTELARVLGALRTGPYGVPQDMAAFALLALAHSGLLTLSSRGRAMPLEFLRTLSLESVDSVAPGELVSAADRDTLASQCRFLAPGEGWTTFGLRQQREAWQALAKLKAALEPVLAQLDRQVLEARTYAAFATFDLDRISDTCVRLRRLMDEIKTSYPAREGLERFLAAWRAAGLTEDDVALVRQLSRFLARFAQQFLFISHYARHRSVEQAAGESVALEQARRMVLGLLEDPLRAVVPDDGERLSEAFSRMREEYGALYQEAHARFHKARQRPALSRHAERGMALLRRLSSIEALDQPRVVRELLVRADAPQPAACTRSLAEELQRSPVCDCGFVFGQTPEAPVDPDPSAAIERALAQYRQLLASPQVLEALAARAFALQDMNPSAAGRLQALRAALEKPQGESLTALLDLLDETTVTECRTALAGATPVVGRSVEDLSNRLAGRRLTRARIMELVSEWIGSHSGEPVITIDQGPQRSGASPAWWPLLHPDLLPPSSPAAPELLQHLESDLEREFPAERLLPELRRLPLDRLAAFVAEEPVHTRAIEAAWRLLATGVLARNGQAVALPLTSRHLGSAGQIAWRLKTLAQCRERLSRQAPALLTARLPLTALWSDTWTDQPLRRIIGESLKELTETCSDWLASLAPLAPLPAPRPGCVLILDAVPPDVWLEALERCALLREAAIEWRRLDGPTETVHALQALFGLGPSQDPLETLPAKGVAYHTIEGSEGRPAAELVTPPAKGETLLVRVNALDRAAHDSAGVGLAAMPEQVTALIERHVPSLRALCRGKPLLLTSDHGLTFDKGRLRHGAGGVFEQAVPLISVAPGR